MRCPGPTVWVIVVTGTPPALGAAIGAPSNLYFVRAAGLSRPPRRGGVASRANLSSGTLDGCALQSGDRVLLLNDPNTVETWDGTTRFRLPRNGTRTEPWGTP